MHSAADRTHRARHLSSCRTLGLGIALALVSLGASAQKIVGLWESASSRAPRDGQAFHFREDGRFERYELVLFDIGFAIEDGEVVLVNRAGPDQPLDLEMGDGYMDMIVPDGRVVRKTKLASPPGRENLLFGDWSFPYEDLGTAFERYTETGRMMFRLPLRVETGTYETKGKKVFLRYDGDSAKNQKISVSYKERQLILGQGEKARRHVWVEGGLWYGPSESGELQP